MTKKLPYISHWHTGVTVPGFGPKFQLGLMEQYPLMPWYIMPVPGNVHDINYYEDSIKEACKLHLPIALVSTQFEILFTRKEYSNLPMGLNPNLRNVNGIFENIISPFGSTKLWRELGYKWASHDILKQLQKWYRDPPFVLFVSNNEHPKLRWNKWNLYQEPAAKFGNVDSDEKKRKYIGDGYVELYNSLFDGIREGLINDSWKVGSKFIGYNAFVPSFVGRWPKWPEYSLHTEDCITPWVNVWDGASLPYYTNPWDGCTDCNIWSVQTEAMNWAACLDLIDKDYWVELSIWDGSAPNKSDDKRLQYEKAGQKYSPERYKGSAQFGIWLLRPNSVREFRSHNEDLPNYESYFLALCEAIKKIHSNSILSNFWQNSKILKSDWNHPYQTDLPKFFEGVNRSYLLWNNLLPLTKKLHDIIPVFSIGFINDNNDVLIYAHAPLEEKKNVVITFCNKSITVDVPIEGAFWLVDNQNNINKI